MGVDRRPPAKLFSLPTAIEKVKHTPTGGHVTIERKSVQANSPSLTQPYSHIVYVYVCVRVYICTRMQNGAWGRCEDKRKERKREKSTSESGLIGGSRVRGSRRKLIRTRRASLSRFTAIDLVLCSFFAPSFLSYFVHSFSRSSFKIL